MLIAIQTAIEHEGDTPTRTVKDLRSLSARHSAFSRTFCVRRSRYFLAYVKENNLADGVRVIHGDRFVAFDGASNKKDEEVLGFMEQFIGERLQSAEFHPDGWPPLVVRDPKEVQAKLRAVAGDKYSYRQMDEFTELIEKTLTIPQVSKVNRSGLLNENVFLLYSQERLAAYNIKPGTLEDAMRGRNISTSGGQVNVEGKNVTLEPGGEFKSVDEIGNVLVPTANGSSVYVRDLVDVVRG